MKRNAVSVSLVVLSLLSVPAAADPPPSPRAAGQVEPAWKVNQRRETFGREGKAFAKQGRWAEARGRFQQVIDLRSDPRTLLWLGYCEEQLGHLVQASSVYGRARDDARAAAQRTEERDATEALATLAPKIPRLILLLPADVRATVSLDGNLVDAREVPIDPGKHQVTAKSPGRVTFSRDLDVAPGDASVVDVNLRLLPPPPPTIERAAPPRRSSTGPIVLGAGGAVLTVIGAALLGAGSRHGHTDGPMQVTGGTALAVGTGAGIAALVWGLGYGDNRSGRSAPATLTASPLPGGGWAEIQGRF